MKFLLLFTLLCLSLQCKNNIIFYCSVLDDFGQHSYYIPIKISTSQGLKLFVIKNNDFYLKTTPQLIQQEQYKPFLLPKIQHMEPLVLPDTFKLDSDFLPIDLSCLDTIGNTDKIIQKYFTPNNVMCEDLSEQQIACIICRLFQDKIAVKQDDYSGFYIYSRNIKAKPVLKLE